MAKFILLFISLCFSLLLPAQNFTGQWKGVFYDKSTEFSGWGGDQCEYVLDVECNGSKVSGYSYTYFTDGPKRYYTICRIEGFLDKRRNYIEIREVERTKTNVPEQLRNCFQVHKLSYTKRDDDENLDGSWIPAPDQSGNCGYGVTTLERRMLNNTYRGFSRSGSQPVAKAVTQTTKIPAPIKRAETRRSTPVVETRPLSSNTRDSQQATIIPGSIPKTDLSIITRPGRIYEKRTSNLLKSIMLESDLVKIDLYDNGEIDGDSISLFLNGKLLMASKRLTNKPITISLSTNDLETENDLVMYAENLGTIPPNTALMVVTDGHRRYEVRITSDLQKSGTIRFIKK